MNRVLTAAGAAAAAAAVWRRRQGLPGGHSWQRINHRGGVVSLAEGPAFAIGAISGLVLTRIPGSTRLAAVIACGGAGAFGLLDDLAEQRGATVSKGLRGHLAAARRGEVTTGFVKIIGIGGAAAVSAALIPNLSVPQRVLGAGLIAGTANLLNLFDLRPGRALKVAGLLSVPLVGDEAAGQVCAPLLGAAAPMVVVDLQESGMLGDCGANAAGALIGLGVVLAGARQRHATVALAAPFIGVLALTLASERVSFSEVIADNRLLNAVDLLGRQR